MYLCCVKADGKIKLWKEKKYTHHGDHKTEQISESSEAIENVRSGVELAYIDL